MSTCATIERNKSVESPSNQQFLRSDSGPIFLLALFVFLLHIVTNGQYGFHRDELLTFDNARHLSWGYVVYPPMTAFLARVELEVFGNSLRGFRFFAALAQSLAIIFTGLAARELGGKRAAQLLAASAVAISGPCLYAGGSMSYTSLDYFWWVFVAYFVIRLLKSEDPRWWLAIGTAAALGLMTKYTMAFLVLGVLGGTLVTPTRRYLKNSWLWCGAALSLFIILPNLLWQMDHHFIWLDFIRTIHARDMQRGGTDYFLFNQLWKDTSPVTVPLWCAGLWYVFVVPEGKRYRLLGWMYVIPLIAFVAAKGRDYYFAPAYPMLFAAGGVWVERWLSTLEVRTAWAVLRPTRTAFAISGLIAVAIALPVAPVNSTWWRVADQLNGGNFNSQIGWPDVVATVAKIRDSLPPQDQAKLGILAGDSGENGAVNLYGPAYGLPRAVSGMNSNWLRGYGDPPPETVIVMGEHRDFVDRNFASCYSAGRLTNRYGIVNDTIGDYDEVFVCRHLLQPWPEFWKHFQHFA